MLDELTGDDSGILLADRAYLLQPIKEQLLVKQRLELSIPTKYGRPCSLSSEQLVKRKRLLRSIEIVGSQLTHDLHIKKLTISACGVYGLC